MFLIYMNLNTRKRNEDICNAFLEETCFFLSCLLFYAMFNSLDGRKTGNSIYRNFIGLLFF